MSTTTKRIVIVAFCLLLGAGVVFGFVLYQVMGKGDLLLQQVEALETQRAQESSYFRLVRQAEETAEKRAQLQKYFLRKEDESIDFLYLVESIAPEAGVILETNKLESIQEKDSKNTWIETSFSFSGTRHDVQNFVKILESLPYVQRLTALDMTAQSTNQWQANVTMRVMVLAYDE